MSTKHITWPIIVNPPKPPLKQGMVLRGSNGWDYLVCKNSCDYKYRVVVLKCRNEGTVGDLFTGCNSAHDIATQIWDNLSDWVKDQQEN